MPKAKKPGRPKIGRVTVTVRLFPKIETLLKRAAKAAKLEQGRYIEKALKILFEQDGILNSKEE
jgi:hypothetical protein